MNNRPQIPAEISASRRVILYILFFLISLGLGYPVLNRYDPRQIPGLSDVQSYAALVTGAPVPGPPHLRFRVLVPFVAKAFYLIGRGHIGSWDPLTFSLLTADAIFVAATALLIVVLGIRQLGSYTISLIAALLFLVNFATPNVRLAGLVDAGEGFFLLALLWSLIEARFHWLPLIAVLGALTKESFVPFGIVFTLCWWLAARKKLESHMPIAHIISSWLAALVTFACLQRFISGSWVGPIAFVISLHGNHDYVGQIASSLLDRNLLYIFVWLLPTAIPHLRQFPKSWLTPTAATALTALALNAYYGGAPGTLGRALFSIAGPLLALSSASWLCSPSLQISRSQS